MKPPILLPLSMLPLLACAAGDPLPPLTFPGQASVDSLQANQAACEWRAPGSVTLRFAKTAWPNVHFTAGRAYPSPDWSGVGALAIEVANPGKEPLPVHIRVDDSSLADGSMHCRSGGATLEAGERATLVLPLDASHPGMRAGPPLALEGEDNPRLCEAHGSIDSRNVVKFQLFLAKPDQPRELELARVRWLPKTDPRGIVDRFGQYAKADWPGKIHSEDELAQARAGEVQWLLEHAPVPGRDEYGGWKDGPQLEPGGFFRTQRVDGSWWLVTPAGHLFWSIGADCVRASERSPLRGRETMFSWLPEGAAESGGVDFYQVNLRRKYGEAWAGEWARLACERLPAWGFNTIGNWSDPAVFRLRRVPYTATIHLGGLPLIGAKLTGDGHDRRLPDYFDEAFPGKAEAAITKAVAEWRNDPWCIGYFVDNELNWDSWAQGGAGGEYKVAREVLASPVALAARVRFIDQLRGKYGSVEAFARAWELPVASWDAPLNLAGKRLTDAARTDCSAFLIALADRYFTAVRSALKRHAPQQLYLGCRFAIRPREVVEVAARYCDVMSFNIYQDSVAPDQWKFTEELGKPVIIGEFHFGAVDRGMFHPGLRRTANQAARAGAFVGYVESVLAMPAFVGCHWFQYADQPLTGRFDGENYNIGLVTITDTPHPELRDAARAVNSRIYSLRANGSK